jgi:hypothetical protein
VKSLLFGLFAVSIAASLHAQMPSQGLPVERSTGEFYLTNRADLNFSGRSPLETPTMRKQKLARAVALRDEALKLQAQDGGVLTGKHAHYIQSKADRILAFSIMPGSGVVTFPSQR